jgi:CTP synthase (UTP-ammonia lyase)
VDFVPGSLLARVNDAPSATEPFFCNYGLAPEYELLLEEHGLRVSARGPEGEARALELAGHPFLLGTLYIPQMRPGHPVVTAFVEAARAPV